MKTSRNTKSVKALLRIFEQAKNDVAISVVDLVKRLQKEMNKTTVYRILQRLEDNGVVHSFTGKDGLKWYAKCNGCSSENHQDTHPHFQCKICGKTKCIAVDIPIPVISKHQVDTVEFLLIGRCEDCLRN
ncbi:MAG: transcriptional repressor [Bacteroidota bacterium]